jgi:hypothetical protein
LTIMADGELDHLVYATPDVDATVADLDAKLGVRAVVGGRHVGRGTRNALIGLSEFSYLEILGPDATQLDVPRPLWFGIDSLSAPRLMTWAIQLGDVERVMGDAARAGVILGTLAHGSRETADGSTIRWRLTNPDVMLDDGLVPFLIDWGRSRHPAATAPRGVALRSLRGEHPDAHRVSRHLAAVGATLSVARAPRPALIAHLVGRRGEVEIR